MNGPAVVDHAVLPIDLSTPLPPQAGGKARGLQQLVRAGLRVPAAWVVLPSASAAAIAALASGPARTLGGLLAVRSSAIDEDDQQASFAGIHDTLLGVAADDLPEAVARVRASALSDRARSYREHTGLAPAAGACAVVVQQLIASQSAGVAFSAGDDGTAVVVEAVEGLGEMAVNGTARPQTLLLRLSTGAWRVEREQARWQPEKSIVTDAGVSHVPVAAAHEHDAVVSPSQAADIAACVARLERLCARPLDTEWAWTAEGLWFLQARPRTRPLQERVPAGQTWTRMNLREVLADLPSAFMRSTLGPALDEGQHAILRRHGVRLDRSVPLVAFVYGRPVINERMLLFADLLGVPREASQAEFGGSAAPSNAIPSMDFATALRHPGVLLRAIVIALRAERQARRFLARLDEIRPRLAARAATPGASDTELLDVLRRAFAGWTREIVIHAMAVGGALTNAQYPVLRRLRHHPAPRALLSRLVAGGPPSVSTEQVDDLVALAAAIREWTGGASFARAVTAQHASEAYWRERLPADVWAQVRRWLERYGHRGPYESDLASPRYGEDLRLLAGALFPLVLAPPPARLSSERRQEDALRAWEEVEGLCGAAAARRTRAEVRRTKQLMALREELRSQAVATLLPLRRIVLELGRRLVERGQLGAAADVWHLSFEEVERAIAHPSFMASVAVARERARLAAWRRLEVPNRFSSEQVASMPSRSDEAAAEKRLVFQGNGVSPGTVEGEVRVLASPTEHARFPAGSVLVTRATDPAWTLLFARAAAVVVELGGALSHAGIVAREYGIPCVANIDGITGQLCDGDVVRVDGASGMVTVVSRTQDTSRLVGDERS